MGPWLWPLIASGVPVTFLSATLAGSFFYRVPTMTGISLEVFSKDLMSITKSNITCILQRNHRVAAVAAKVLDLFLAVGGPRGGLLFSGTTRQNSSSVLADGGSTARDEFWCCIFLCGIFWNTGHRRAKMFTQGFEVGQSGAYGGLKSLDCWNKSPVLRDRCTQWVTVLPNIIPTACTKRFYDPDQIGICQLMASPSSDDSIRAAPSSLPKRDGSPQAVVGAA